MLNNPDRPVQIVFAGKAHPKDDPGKQFIQQVILGLAQRAWKGKVVFLEEYDMNVARYLVHGVDMWLNTPAPPLRGQRHERQKASLNGVPNFSVLDGWWAEGYNGKNGWAIGEGHEYGNPDEQDWNDAHSLYSLLEDRIVPLYYDRNAQGISDGWCDVMKEAISDCAPQLLDCSNVEGIHRALLYSGAEERYLGQKVKARGSKAKGRRKPSFWFSEPRTTGRPAPITVIKDLDECRLLPSAAASWLKASNRG